MVKVAAFDVVQSQNGYRQSQKSRTMVKVAAFDVGFRRDAFAMVAAAANITPDRIQLLNSKEWWNKDIITVAEKIRSIHSKMHFDRFVCEANNQPGHRISTKENSQNLRNLFKVQNYL